MAKLIITRGLQGSGKTTRVKKWIGEDPIRRARVNRDDLRSMVHNGFWDGWNTEKLIVRMRDQLITMALRMGQDVICDDTNLDNKTARDLRAIALRCGAEFEVWDLTDVPLEVCIERDAGRVKEMKNVGERVIRLAHEKYVKGREYPLPIIEPTAKELAKAGFAPYEQPDGGDEAVIVDIDGTIAHMAGRSPYDETRVHEDTPNAPVVEMIKRLRRDGVQIIFCSGRTDKCRVPTKEWIMKHLDLADEDFVLFMRKAGDQRKDSIVKREIFENYIRGAGFRIIGVFDDRQQVVDMWRDELGLTCFQVAPGDF